MDHAGGDARAAGEGSSGQQGCLDILAAVLDLHPEQVAPSPVQVTLLPRLLTPPPEPVVDGDDDGEEVGHLSSLLGQIQSFIWSVLSSFLGEDLGFCFPA